MISPQSEVTYWGAAPGVDSTGAFRQCADWCGLNGEPIRIPDGQGDYLLSGKVQIKATRDLSPTDTSPSSDLHFTQILPISLLGEGTARVRAVAGGFGAMFEYIYDTSDGDQAPYYSKIEGVHFDGADFGLAGISSQYAMHLHYHRNRFVNLDVGIGYTGYGVAHIEGNVFRCKKGVSLVGGGGDSFIGGNDFYSPGVNSAGVYLGWWGGNNVIRDNVFTSDVDGAAYGVQMAGTTAPGSQEIRNNLIEGNEFCGLSSGVRIDGKPSIKNVWNCVISKNHTIPFGAQNFARLLAAVDCSDILVADNFVNGRRLTDGEGVAIEIIRGDDCIIHGNVIGNLKCGAILLTDCKRTSVTDNRITNVGKNGPGYSAIALYGAGSDENSVRRNTIRQTSTSYAQSGIVEATGVDYTFALDNSIYGMANPLVKVGSHSVMTAGV